ncbi:NAD(P)-binding domain-containing protein [Helcobacillus massiliensis]|uniref:Cation diffusion facilitator CzcD-associated flavoprotein CzcO n=1 Tax=Helcobacillus massiliensis TaxID=521392 RepID=A0A839R0H9_9MICO|nr:MULTISPECIES: NAD(P)-binding domain-containing protein [Helcobacillus]MBB3023257.1 cation diffusion facilitator CzcD-associated flavoprotein CzcO [Helcobacillus massiliensis]MCG7427675.1 NAD(P)-binding domain-containing protein [Helcobacillus sp. ACRRO]MCT1556568.1 NAD(P)-binding domain-containing protein [Helcobacillus massiliensis]MCT2035762.1 NAD(P)-binding domain-containing protein [Helcobacillus massiliensis]MCT2331156.1 NAD(P)-binding domain-containing protein [Helcobacillus massilien
MPKKTLVIGAGPAGLAAASYLKRAGLPFDLVDGRPQVGGVWCTEAPDAPAWPGMRMHSSKSMTEFDGLRMPVSFPTFPTAEQYGMYLRAFVAHADLSEEFEPNTQVRSARSLKEGLWEVEFSTGEVRPYSAVIVATGASTRRILPTQLRWDVEDAGVRWIHSDDYAGSEQTPEGRVLVVGSTQSAADVAVDLAGDPDRRITMLWEERRWVVPRSIGPVPADAIASAKPGFLGRLNEKIAAKAVSALQGDQEAAGLPLPSTPLLESEPVVSDELLPLVRDHRIALALDGRHLPLESFDLVVFATGHEAGVDVIDPALTADMYLDTFPRDRGDLAVLGQVSATTGTIPLLQSQAEIAALQLRAQAIDPAAAEEFARVRTSSRAGLEEGLDQARSIFARGRVRR